MFSFPWTSSARNEKVIPGMAKFTPTKQELPPMAQIALFNKMKRKRSPSLQRTGSPGPKRSTETMSHVQIPAPETERALLSAQGTQVYGGQLLHQPEATPFQRLNRNLNSDPENIHPQDQSCHDKSMDSPGLDCREGGARPSSVGCVRRTALCEAIEAQFGLEILLKHKELRLIDQESAKCQVALEQLRRCQTIPYPATSSGFEDMQAVSSGSGPVFNNQAPYAPPWGVANGPYSRHYERWLIPDSAFDDSVTDNVKFPTPGGKTVPDRATRGSNSEIGTVAGKSRSQRGSNSARLKALPHGYPEPKEEKGPMIVKRGSDGKMVKLVCLDCRRSNFNSAQGFINHCRIAHSRQFLSHDAAIEASGEEVDMDADGGVGEMNNGSQAMASAGLVHPLIRSAHLARAAPMEPPTFSSSSKRKRSHASAIAENPPSRSSSNPQAMSTPQQTNIMTLTSRPEPTMFTPSPQTPHLSALFARQGLGGDLDEMVAQAKARPDIDLSLSDDDDDEDEDEEAMEVAAGITNAPQSRSTRGVLRGGELPARTTKSPSPSEQSPIQPVFSNTSQKPAYLSKIDVHQAYPSPYQSGDGRDNHDTPMLNNNNNNNTPFNLSPNTIEAHTAPSLVSDDGDYENTHSESESPSSAEADDDEDHYIHAEVMDHDDMDLGEGSSADHHLGLGGGKPHGSAAGRRASVLRPPLDMHTEATEARHVSFANPVRRVRRCSRTKDGK